MKKFLLTAVAALMATFTYAQKVTLDFTNPVEDWNLPVKANAITEATQVSNGTYTITLSASTAAYAGGSEKNGYTYLMLGKMGSTLTLPAFDFAVGKIEVVGNAGASASTLMNIYVGEDAVSTETTGSIDPNTYVIADAKQAAGTVYTLKVNSAHNAQIIKINIYEAGDEPIIGPDPQPQPDVDVITIAEAQKTEANSEVAVQGTVVAVCGNGFVLQDNTGYIFHYGATDNKVGDVVTVSGAVTPYGGFNQFKSATIVVKSTGTVKYPEPQVMTGADLDAWFAAPQIAYVQFTGKLTVSGNYYNVTVEGAETAVGSLINPSEDIKAKISNGNEYTFTGYAMYTSGGKYVNVVVTDAKAQGEVVVLKDISNTLETAYTVSQAIAIINDEGNDLSKKVYVKGIISAPYKDLYIDVNYGNATFFISEDGSDQSQQFEIYRGYDFGGAKFTDDTRFKLGDEVVYYGTLTKYNETYETNQGAELITVNGLDATATGISSINANRQNAIYDLQGRRVNNAAKGIYIIGGKKVLK